MNDWELILNDYEQDNIIEESSEEGMCCGGEMIRNSAEAVQSCQECGRCVSFIELIIKHTESRLKYKSIYKPMKHLEFKLKEIQGLLIPETKRWRSLFKGSSVSTIWDVRRILKKHKSTHLNRYTYYYFEQLTGHKVFTLSPLDIDSIRYNFKVLLVSFRKFKSSYGRKNIFNYHFILKQLLEIQRIDITNKLFAPKMLQSSTRNKEIWDGIVENIKMLNFEKEKRI